MYGRIVIEIPDKDTPETKTEEYTFVNLDEKVVLDSYVVVERKTKRHKWTHSFFSPRYSRLEKRDSNITREEVPLPQEVIDLALEKMRERIEFDPSR